MTSSRGKVCCALAVKVFGANLDTLEQKGKQIKQILEHVRGITEVTLVQELGQPSLSIKINRALYKILEEKQWFPDGNS